MTSPTHAYVLLNGECLPAIQARVSPLSEAFMFGRALFETVRVIGGEPAFLPDHVERLLASCRACSIGWSTPLAELYRRCRAIVAANSFNDGCLKIVAFADVGGPAELITTRPNPYLVTHYARGFRLVGRQLKSSGVTGLGHKSTSYLANLLAREEAREQQCDDALLINAAGNVLEGAATNVFIVKDGVILTPPLEAGILPGVARRQVLTRWKTNPVREETVTREMLVDADEVFVTNALLGIMPVATVDDRVYQMGNYVVTPQLMAGFSEWARGSIRFWNHG